MPGWTSRKKKKKGGETEKPLFVFNFVDLYLSRGSHENVFNGHQAMYMYFDDEEACERLLVVE